MLLIGCVSCVSSQFIQLVLSLSHSYIRYDGRDWESVWIIRVTVSKVVLTLVFFFSQTAVTSGLGGPI